MIKERLSARFLWYKPFMQKDGIIRQNDETAKTLLQLDLTCDIIIMGRGERAKTPPKIKQREVQKMTINEIKNRIHELDNKMFYLEMADRMTTAEQDTYQRLLIERNRLAEELYYRTRENA